METRMLVGGELVAGDGPPLDVENPFDESPSDARTALSSDGCHAAVSSS